MLAMAEPCAPAGAALVLREVPLGWGAMTEDLTDPLGDPADHRTETPGPVRA
jgi:hypothetical protein